MTSYDITTLVLLLPLPLMVGFLLFKLMTSMVTDLFYIALTGKSRLADSLVTTVQQSTKR